MPTIGDLLTLHGQEPMISIDINSPRISGRPQHIQCDSRCHYLPHHPLNLRNQAPASPTSSVSSTFPFFSRYLSVDLGSSRTPLRRVAAASLFCFVSLEKDEYPPRESELTHYPLSRVHISGLQTSCTTSKRHE